MELSVGLPPGPEFADLAALAEELGYSRVWIFDSAPQYEDPFVHLALAAARTSHIGFGTAVLIPKQRSLMAMASGIATIARLAPGRLRVCFGSGFTSMVVTGQKAMTQNALFEYVASVRALLAGQTVVVDGAVQRMVHWKGLTADRPIDVPIWLSVFGPKGALRAPEVAEGVVGPVHPTLPSATMVSGTVLEPGEEPNSERVLRAVGPWRVLGFHATYARGGAAAVDALPGGAQWRAELEALLPEGQRHLLTFEGHVTHLADRDMPLLRAASVGGAARGEITGDPAAVRSGIERVAGSGYQELIYTPSGPDVARELRAFAAARP
jgi:5,10-methylenetetrahydromethanopterin reductase